jgi:hypothetical protein
MDKKLTPARRRGIEALLTHATYTAAADAAGVSRNTLWRWMQDEAFCDVLRRSESELLAGVSRQLATLAALSLSALSDTLTQPNNKTELKLRAAEIALSKFAPVRDLLTVEARLAAMEERLNAKAHEAIKRT